LKKIIRTSLTIHPTTPSAFQIYEKCTYIHPPSYIDTDTYNRTDTQKENVRMYIAHIC
jgi:hypothetical protein